MMGNIFPPNAKRVFCQTDEDVNDIIKQETEINIKKYIGADENSLTKRIDELNSEWDTERVLETHAAAALLTISLIGICKRKKLFAATGIISYFLLMHALDGWCPPLPIIRKLGIRTSEEISDEKAAIKFLRGDFSNLNQDAEEIMDTVSED